MPFFLSNSQQLTRGQIRIPKMALLRFVSRDPERLMNMECLDIKYTSRISMKKMQRDEIVGGVDLSGRFYMPKK